LYSPWVALRLLKKFDKLRITLDYSHWVLCIERPLTVESSPELLQFIISRTDHIHARIGTNQTPQIDDPMNPRHQFWTEHFQSIWKFIYLTKFSAGKVLTITPEYGPEPYQPHESRISSENIIIHEVDRLRSVLINNVTSNINKSL